MNTRAKCEMVFAHHPDCRCEWCRQSLDEVCAATAVAHVIDSRRRTRVCEECALDMQLGAFDVAYDDGRTGPLS